MTQLIKEREADFVARILAGLAEAQWAETYPYGGRRAGPLDDGRMLCSVVVASSSVSDWVGRRERGAQEESAARRRFHSCGSSSPMRDWGCVCTRSSTSAR